MIIKSKEFERPSEGIHNAVIVKIEDLGIQHGAYGEQDRMRVDWQVEEVGKDGKPLQIASWFNKTVGRKSKFGPFVQTLTGTWPKSGFNTDSLLNRRARIFVKHILREDGTPSAKVSEILAPLNIHGVAATDADVEFPGDQASA